jgi:hypothetical protein
MKNQLAKNELVKKPTWHAMQVGNSQLFSGITLGIWQAVGS